MDKSALLNDTHQKFLKMGLCILPMIGLEEIVSVDYMGFGTTVDERIFSLIDLRNLIQRQKEQSEGMDIRYDIQNIYRRLSPHGLSAILADDITLFLKIGDEEIQIQLRFSCMYEYLDNKWMAIHSHGSKPENVKTEEDTWGIDEWKKRNLELETQIKERTAELEKSLDNLRATQTQLIQSEKLASLGELTAGIAHEIQNPLNFVNNFSEVSSELIGEMNTELEKGDIDEAKEIANDLKQNLKKINHHGKRASSIVKGMLEHSRTSTGVKELTDINQLADEYLRLSFHGIRAKDNTFNTDFELIANENLPKIEVIPQDMGRVLLNLINNAFWAVNERSKKGEDGYEPKVTVSTQLIANSQVLIAIKDNGVGMSETTKTKIFQPFFTTKPTGQGTRLGLSLAYDIVTKGHGGTVEVESVEGEGSEFSIKIPF